uniref:Uncharacterized protein n=1 Tax=Anopheles atroparvus TaxID=41427 RepID=A0AAG5DXC6_ANOAO
MSRSRSTKRLAVLVDPCLASLRLTEGVVTRSRAKLLAGGSPEIARRKSSCIPCDQR